MVNRYFNNLLLPAMNSETNSSMHIFLKKHLQQAEMYFKIQLLASTFASWALLLNQGLL